MILVLIVAAIVLIVCANRMFVLGAWVAPRLAAVTGRAVARRHRARAVR